MDYNKKVIALLNDKELSQEQKEKLEEIFPELIEQESSEKISVDKRLYEHIRNAKACIDDALSCDSIKDCMDYCSQAAYDLGMVEAILREHEQKPANKMDTISLDILFQKIK